MVRRLLVFTFLVSCIYSSAQHYFIKYLDLAQALSNNHVVSITQDKCGFIWAATEEGLNKFDGNKFISYYKGNNENHYSITSNQLNCVLDDPSDSIIWIGTQRNGLNSYNYYKNLFTYYQHDKSNKNSIIANDITRVIPAHDGNLWICTYWQGIDYLDKKHNIFKHYNISTVKGLPSNQVWTAHDDKKGRLYVGHVNDGLSIINIKNKQAVNFKHNSNDNASLPGDEVSCIFSDSSDNIWIGTNRGLALYNKFDNNFIHINDKDKNLSHRIYDIKQVDDNNLWVAMESGGIAIISLSQNFKLSNNSISAKIIKEEYNNYGLSNSSVRCLFQDTYKNMWVGTWGGGISFIGAREPFFKTYKFSPNIDDYCLTNKIVSSLCYDKTGNLWVGTDGGGINIFKNGRRTHVYNSINANGRNNIIQASFCDSEGNVWLGDFNNGLCYYSNKDKNFHNVLLNNKMEHDVRYIVEDKNGKLWVCTSDGIYCINIASKQCVGYFNCNNKLTRCVYVEDNGYMWIGTFGAGIIIVDKNFKVIKSFNVDNNFPSNTINSIYKDAKNKLWVATGEGLVLFNDINSYKYKVYSKENGLANTYIQAIKEDRNGNLWISSNNGISCLMVGKDKFYNYTSANNTQFGCFSTGAVTVDNNNLYFGSLDGVCYFNPANVLQEKKSPKAVITSIEVNSPISNGEDNSNNIIYINDDNYISLNYQQNSFNVNFNIQDYSLADDVEYSYQLKGLSDLWYTIPNNHSLTFRNIPAGKYELYIRTRMHNQKWSDEVTRLVINIDSPLWLTWWAKSIYVLFCIMIAFIIIYVYRRRIYAEAMYRTEKHSHQQEQELNDERLRFYTNITHELRTPLTLILGPLEDMLSEEKISGVDRQKISIIHKSAMRLLNLINQILEFRKTETQNKQLSVAKGCLGDVVNDVALKYKELNRNNNLSINIEIKDKNEGIYFDTEIIHIILDNLISNACKYTHEGSVTVSLCNTKQNNTNYTNIIIKDTGVGISQEALPHIFQRYYQEKSMNQASGTGIGLALVKSLVTLHEGEIKATSKQKEGSTFTVSILTDNSYPNAFHSDITQNVIEGKTFIDNDDNGIENDESNISKQIMLVVEDDADIRMYLEDSFRNKYDVKCATNGEEGLNLAYEYIPDIIISDIMMPIKDGINMCRDLKKDIRTSHIPIILLTAKDSIKDREEGYSIGADSYITKPFSASLLNSRINNLLDSRRNLANYFINYNDVDQVEKNEVMGEALSQIDNDFLKKIEQIIKEKMSSEKLDINTIAIEIGMSKSTLYRKMKALTGLSSNGYIRKIRLKHAEAMLLEGNLNISEIAYKVGINNIFYFRKCFKEEYGLTPSEYKKEYDAKQK